MRTLDDIIPPSRRPAREAAEEKAPLHLIKHPPRFPMITTVIVIAIIAGAIGALFYFSGARVQIVPTSASVSVQAPFTATNGSGTLPFIVVSADKIATQSVAGTGTKNVSSNASGQITIYNKQAKVQKLIATTRFATTAGLIFRIRTAVTVPAGTAANPGSAQATVYADQPGASYNVDPTSFTLPGLAGTAQAALVYGQSSAAMTGGASGNVPTVDPAVEKSATTALSSALAPELAAALQTQIPEGYVLVPGATSISYQELAPVPSATTGNVDVKEQGTISAALFRSTDLAASIASSTPGLAYNGEPIMLSSVTALTLVPSAKNAPTAATPTYSFTLSGTAPLVYVVDPSRIASAIAGKTRQAAQVALSNYPEVKSALLILRPFWRSAFPEDPASITVTVETPQ